MNLARRFLANSRTHPRTIILLSIVSALSTTAVVAVVNKAAGAAASGDLSMRLLALMGLATAAFAVSQKAVTRIVAREIERMIFRLRTGLFEDVRRADLTVLNALGRAPLHAALTRDMQSISRNLPIAVIGIQQLLMLVCVALYLMVLSLPAFVLTAVFATASIFVHLSRMQPVTTALRQAAAEDDRLFDGLRDLLLGFSQVRTSRPRAAALHAELEALSDGARVTKTAVKKRWGNEFALIQVMFYLLVGLMVFAVPLFTTDYHVVVVKATTTVLFMIGPIGTVVQAMPALSQAEAALADVEAKRAGLRALLVEQADETAEALPAPVRELAVKDIRFTYRDPAGQGGFSVGPISAGVKAGELVFITGGNGSGKSTLLHLLTALVPPMSGRILVNGEPLTVGRMQAYRDNISAVFSDYHLFKRLYGMDPAVVEARAPGLLARLEMQDKVTVVDGAFSTIDLSQGQRKRLALVVAELEDKPVLVLDEWAADQDPHFRAVFYEQILPELRARGKIVLCVTHDDRWFHKADRILHMAEGRLSVVDPPGRDA